MMREQDMDAMNSGDESDNDLISTEMLEDISDRIQNHINVNRIEARYKTKNASMPPTRTPPPQTTTHTCGTKWGIY